MKINFYFISFIVLFFTSCSKEENRPASPKKLSLVWSYDAGSYLIDNTKPFLFEDQIVFAAQGSYNGLISPLFFFNRADGSLDTVVSLPRRIYGAGLAQSWPVGDKFIVGGFDRVYAYSLSNKQVLWQSNVTNGGWSIYPFENHFYQGVSYTSLNRTRYAIDKIDQGNGYRSTVYLKPWSPEVRGNFHSMAFANLANGDEVLVAKFMAVSDIASPPYDYWMDVVAINLTKDSLMWVNRKLEYAEYSFISSEIKDSMVYLPGDSAFYALNLYTGAVEWEFKGFDSNRKNRFGNGDFTITNDRVLVKLNSGIYILNRFNGALINKRTNNGTGLRAKMLRFENKLIYSAAEGLFIIDDYNGGTILFEDNSRFDGFGYSVGIDTAFRYLYTTSFQGVLCLKLPDDL